MIDYLYYNVYKYINSIWGFTSMVLEGIMSGYSKCKKYEISKDVQNYLYFIGKQPFYVAPQFSIVKTNTRQSSLNPQLVLFSAPGATGKTALAEYLAYNYGALYWNLAKIKLGTNSFAGSILKAVGPQRYSSFVSDLNDANLMLIIDALDEAEVISGRKMLCNFVSEICASVKIGKKPSVFLLARTETAQVVASYCAENGISILHYEIGFFTEESAKEFIEKKISSPDNPLTRADQESVNAYYNAVKRNITEEESRSFLGYAPVLEAISKHIKTSPNRAKLISELSGQTDCVSLIMRIMKDLLDREQNKKVVPGIVRSLGPAHPEFTDWSSLYGLEEQLVRIVNYLLFNDTNYSNYPIPDLPPQIVDEYQTMLDTFLPQHPFIRNTTEGETVLDFTGPAFRDYTLAELILRPMFADLAYTYFEESQSKSYFPSQIFFDCYTSISNKVINTDHLSFVYDSFRAKAMAADRPFMHCSIPKTTPDEESSAYVSFNMIPGNKDGKNEESLFTVFVNNNELTFSQVMNVSIEANDCIVNIGRAGVDALISNSSIECKELHFATGNISIESFLPDGCLLVAHDSITGNPSIEIVRSDLLKVSAPNVSDYYRLIPYKYNFEDASLIDITKFAHALRSILMEFRTDKKDTLGKTAEKIDFVTVGGSEIKRKVLEYMKDASIVYQSSHLYKINEDKMQEKGINFTALSRMDVAQLALAYDDFCVWLQA